MKKSSERGQAARKVCNLLSFLVLFDYIKNRYVIGRRRVHWIFEPAS